MKVSVVIPAYNEEKYIHACLTSLENQVEKPDEIILVDNNCTDNTVKIAKRFGVRIVGEKRQGITYARNRGFNEAKYEIIARCDADAILVKDWVKKIKENFENKRLAALVGPVVFYDLPFRTTLSVKSYMWLMKKILGHYPLNGPNMALQRSMWKRIKDIVCVDDKKVHEDIDLSIHISKIGGKIGYDTALLTKISGRRMKNNPRSFFIEYAFRLARMVGSHYTFSQAPKA